MSRARPSSQLWCNLYIYLVERFPTTVRSTGFGVAMGLGRAGGVLSSAVGNQLPSMDVAFVCYSASFLAGLLVALRPAVETARRSLADTGSRTPDRDRTRNPFDVT